MTPRATLIEAMEDARDPTDALDRMLAAMAGLGLRVVPVEATDGMTAAGARSRVVDDPQVHESWKPDETFIVLHNHHHWVMICDAIFAAAPDVLGAGV